MRAILLYALMTGLMAGAALAQPAVGPCSVLDKTCVGQIGSEFVITTNRGRPNSRVTSRQIASGVAFRANSGIGTARLLTKGVFCRK